MIKSRLAFLSAILLILVSVAFAGGKSKSDSQHLKARYFWLEGAKQQAQENYDAAYELFRRANAADPNYTDAKYSKAYYDVFLSEENDTTPFIALREYVDRYPGDIDESATYAYTLSEYGDRSEARRILNRLLRMKPSNTHYLLTIANTLVQDQDYKSALDTLLSYQRQEGMSAQLSEKMVLLCMLSQDTILAEKIMQDGIAQHPESAEYEIVKVNYYARNNMMDSAFNAALRAEQKDPDNGKAKILLAAFYDRQGDSIMYDRKINEALLCDNFDLDDKMNIIVDYINPKVMQGRDLQSAEQLFSTMIEQYPREANILALAASYYSLVKNWDKAIETIQYAIDMDPSNSTYWNQLLYFDSGAERYAKVEEDYNRACKYLEAPDTDMKTTLALSYSLNKQYDKSIDLYVSLIHEIDSTLDITKTVDNNTLRNNLDYETLIRLSNLYTVIGDAYHSLDNKDDSYTCYENALYFNPENSMAMNNYAYFISLSEDGDLEKAAKMSARAVTYEPENASFYDTYAWINYRMGDYANAKILQQKAIELTKDGEESAELYDHYGDILEKCDKHAEAVESWKKALTLDPTNEKIKQKIK